MTFSVAAVCPDTGHIGFAVTPSSVCVGARVGRIGKDCVVFSQARTDPRLHASGLDSFACTNNVRAAIAAMRHAASALHWRQLGNLSRSGEAEYFTGDSCMPVRGGLAAEGCLALGNFLSSDDVLPAMLDAASKSTSPLTERLIAGLQAGVAAGGERDPLQSAALCVLGDDDLVETDLRIDKSQNPIDDLNLLWRDWGPKAAVYRLRALHPDDAPSSSDVEKASSPST